jgi:hypothetical protein
MRIAAACGILFALTFCCLPTLSDRVPIRLAECEAFLCGGLWTLNGTAGKAQWPNDVVAELSVERFDKDQMLVHRKDIAGPFVGLTAVYTGVVRNQRVEGDVTYSWSGRCYRCARRVLGRHERCLRDWTPRDGSSPRSASRSQWSLVVH